MPATFLRLRDVLLPLWLTRGLRELREFIALAPIIAVALLIYLGDAFRRRPFVCLSAALWAGLVAELALRWGGFVVACLVLLTVCALCVAGWIRAEQDADARGGV